MTRWYGVLGLVLASFVWAQGDQVHYEGFAAIAARDGDGPQSWLSGGPGRLVLGDADDVAAYLDLHLAVEWEPSLHFLARAQVLGRAEPDDVRGKSAGLVEALIQASAYAGDGTRFRFKLGMFFPPTSMENTDPLWVSPYSLTLSTINSWVAEEIRFTGLDTEVSHRTASHTRWSAGASVLMGNDSSGSLLAWRGWAQHARLTPLAETLPLPPLTSLDSGAFAVQRDAGTRPFNSDLDNRPGYAARLGLEVPDRLLVRLLYSDSKGDRDFYKWEYSWQQRFLHAGLEWWIDPDLVLAAEYVDGDTGMGFKEGSHVQLDFTSWYVLLSQSWTHWRTSLRYEDFETVDRDRLVIGPNTDLNDEQGESLTAAFFWLPTDSWRIGLEWLDMDVLRPVELVSGPILITGGEIWSLEVRYQF